jgi:hypothetical protein
MSSPRTSPAIATRLLMRTAILATLFLGFCIDTRALQGAVGLLSATAQTPMTQEKTITLPIEGMV